MSRPIRLMSWQHRTLLLALAAACQGDPRTSQTRAAESDDASTPIADLPFIDADTSVQLRAELLARPTALGETTALHVRLPPPRDPRLTDSLVRVLGTPEHPEVVFRSDALAQLGVIARSPGSDFFTAFTTLSPGELVRIQANEDRIASGAFGETTRESVVFRGRSAAGRTNLPPIDAKNLQPGQLTAVAGCAIRPASTTAAWGQSLFVTDPKVVQDPARTWDPCTGAGTKGGAWTFAHLIRELAQGSGATPERFVLDWLSQWLNAHSINGDSTLARPQMFDQVIEPWATASGTTALLWFDSPTQQWRVAAPGLDLDIAPFRLLAVVNRIDLGSARSGYGGSTTSQPVTPGELRFLFGVVQPDPWGAGSDATCGKKPFTAIFEYGVPGVGCSAVTDWARQWTQLAWFPGFTADYLAQLNAMTESVVRHGAAPAKGNQSALDQIRTSEAALHPPGPYDDSWFQLEFTLTAEDPVHSTDPPANGLLQPHTIAQAPAEHFALPWSATTSAFVNGPVTAGVPLPVNNPGQCSASYEVPYSFAGAPFRGGEGDIHLPGWWVSSITATSSAAAICARHQFSLNTCNGCHSSETGTDGRSGSTRSSHVAPLDTIPVHLSSFLTGGGPGLVFNVRDSQLGTPLWPFADLERRYERLFDLAQCTACTKYIPMTSQFIDAMIELGPVPVDPSPELTIDFDTGPITDLDAVQKVLELRTSFAGEARFEPVDFIRAVDAAAH